ncbi:Protein translocase subunit SecA [Trichinella spiralis]|uniref:Protein translocase subunit SecA n=1 Tax=Trichinella spiralis TaxID=6334 RepID=A0ABR3K3C1_TRISP
MKWNDPSPWQDKMERSFSLRNHRIILSSQCGDAFYTATQYQPQLFTLCEDAFYTALRRTTLSSSPWQDEVERLFSLRNHRIISSSQCEDAFYTPRPFTLVG